MNQTTVVTPWSRKELLAKMRDAGWVRISGPTAAYEYPETGAMFYADNYSDIRGIEWRYFANQRRLPGVTP